MQDAAARGGVPATKVCHEENRVRGRSIRPRTQNRFGSAAEDLGYDVNCQLRALRSRAVVMVGDEIAVRRHTFGIVQGANAAASQLALP